mgnify:CR=1 FL=1
MGSYEELKSAISAGKWARGPWAGRYTNSAVFLSIIFVYKFMLTKVNVLTSNDELYMIIINIIQKKVNISLYMRAGI